MNKYIAPIITSLLFFSGCSNYVAYLSPDTKKHVYKTVQDEISKQTTKGDFSYETGYLADAISAYEMVNFYENKAVISLKKINEIKVQAKMNAKYHYNLAIKYYKTDKKRALLEFNNVIKNTPNHKESKQFIVKIKENSEIINFLNVLENSLQQALQSSKINLSHLKKINDTYTKLKQYDPQNPLLSTAYTQVLQYIKLRDKAIKIEKKGSKEELAKLLDEGKDNYNNKNLNTSLEVFQEILEKYPDNDTALIYIKKIKMQLETIKSLE